MKLSIVTKARQIGRTDLEIEGFSAIEHGVPAVLIVTDFRIGQNPTLPGSMLASKSGSQ